MMKYAIAFPLAGRLNDNAFWISFLTMDKPPFTLLMPKIEVYDFAQNIAEIRNDLAGQALFEGVDKLIMMDTDQIYPVDAVKKLLSHDKMVVGAPVHRRYPPFDIIMLRGEMHKYLHVSEKEIYSGDLVEVDATGTGCMCFDMAVFRELEPPWFKSHESGEEPVGEDIYFCSKAREAGIKIYVDTSIEIDHITTFLLNRSSYALYKKLHGIRWNEAVLKGD
jgi:hypothetical protein